MRRMQKLMLKRQKCQQSVTRRLNPWSRFTNLVYRLIRWRLGSQRHVRVGHLWRRCGDWHGLVGQAVMRNQVLSRWHEGCMNLAREFVGFHSSLSPVSMKFDEILCTLNLRFSSCAPFSISYFA
jgi:hypothetical protein